MPPDRRLATAALIRAARPRPRPASAIARLPRARKRDGDAAARRPARAGLQRPRRSGEVDEYVALTTELGVTRLGSSCAEGSELLLPLAAVDHALPQLQTPLDLGAVAEARWRPRPRPRTRRRTRRRPRPRAGRSSPGSAPGTPPRTRRPRPSGPARRAAATATSCVPSLVTSVTPRQPRVSATISTNASELAGPRLGVGQVVPRQEQHVHAHEVALGPGPLLRRTRPSASIRARSPGRSRRCRRPRTRSPRRRRAHRRAGRQQQRVGRAPLVRQRGRSGCRRRAPSRSAAACRPRRTRSRSAWSPRTAAENTGTPGSSRAASKSGPALDRMAASQPKPPRRQRAVGDRAADDVSSRRAVVAHVADAQQARHAPGLRPSPSRTGAAATRRAG